MLIITADDYGRTERATSNILECYEKKRIKSASAMVFMKDSKRASSVDKSIKMEIGLHLNFTELFTGENIPLKLKKCHKHVSSYLNRNKFAQVIYNPLLSKSFKKLFVSQYEEFIKLYKKPPDFINGHHHMHLCANMLIDNIIPKRTRVRGTFTFLSGEKNILNLFYRHILDWYISRRYISTDSFFSIEPINDIKRLQNIIITTTKRNIEIEVHPENSEEIEFILSEQYLNLINKVRLGCFKEL